MTLQQRYSATSDVSRSGPVTISTIACARPLRQYRLRQARIGFLIFAQVVYLTEYVHLCGAVFSFAFFLICFFVYFFRFVRKYML